MNSAEELINEAECKTRYHQEERAREAWDEQCRNKREWKIDAEQVSWGRGLEFQNGRKGDGIVVKVIDCQRYPMPLS